MDLPKKNFRWTLEISKQQLKNIIYLFEFLCYRGCRIEYGQCYEIPHNIFPSDLVFRSKCLGAEIIVSKIYNTDADASIIFFITYNSDHTINFNYTMTDNSKLNYPNQKSRYYCICKNFNKFYNGHKLDPGINSFLSITIDCIYNKFKLNSIAYFTQTRIYDKKPSQMMISNGRTNIKKFMFEDCFGLLVCTYLINTLCPDLKSLFIDLIIRIKKWDIFNFGRLLNSGFNF